jgi:hypothetical protein
MDDQAAARQAALVWTKKVHHTTDKPGRDTLAKEPMLPGSETIHLVITPTPVFT